MSGNKKKMVYDYDCRAWVFRSEHDAKLTYQERKQLPESAFALPKQRRFPLHDCAHVRNAWARLDQAKLTPEERQRVIRAIKQRNKALGCGIKFEAEQ